MRTFKGKDVPLPERVEYEGFVYILSDDPLSSGDWYIDHQKYNWMTGNCVEDCTGQSLAEFINRANKDPDSWHSKKIVASDDPVLNYYGIKSL